MKTGFHATDSETYYVAPSGRTWIVQSDDDLGTQDPVEIAGLPEGAVSADDLLTPSECLDHCRRIEAASGETLIEQD